MKKAVLLVFVAVLSLSCLFAGDITARTDDGRVVILHENGRWEYKASKSYARIQSATGYYGTWEFTDACLDAFVDGYCEMEDYPKDDPMIFGVKATIKELIREEMGSAESPLRLELSPDGTICLSDSGETSKGLYHVDERTRELAVTLDDAKSQVLGKFSSDYRRFYFSEFDYDFVYLERVK